MSPLNGILVGGLRRPCAAASSCAAACAALLLVLTLAGRAAGAPLPGVAPEITDADARRAEKILARLRLLHEAAASGDAAAYRQLASKFYPSLFVKVAELRPGDLSTDLSTAVFLSEKLWRNWSAAGAAPADCRGERPDTYLPLCLGLAGGTARQLLLTKSRLHARWAEALLRSGRGAADPETARALAEMRAARAYDLLLAARVAEALRLIEGLVRHPAGDPERGRRSDPSASQADYPDARLTGAMLDAEALLAWMPRSTTFYRLADARRAYADGLWWQGKARQAKSLVVSANSFAPDPLKVMRLDAEQVSAAAAANWESAARHTRLAEQARK